MLGLIYLAAAFFAFAIVRYFYVFWWTANPTVEDELVVVRVLFSAPMLIILGTLLIVKFRRGIVHRIFGILFVLSGIAWAVEIIQTLIEEAA